MMLHLSEVSNRRRRSPKRLRVDTEVRRSIEEVKERRLLVIYDACDADVRQSTQKLTQKFDEVLKK